MSDTRPLVVRVRAIATMYDARAIGFDKMAQASKQDAANARMTAATLHEACAALEARK